MVIMVGDSSTKKFSENTVATLKTYEAISRQVGKPIIARYYQNHIDGNTSIEQINRAIAYSISDYRLLFSGHVHGVDSADLYNLFNYNRVTDSRPGLTLISSFIVPNKDGNDLKSVLDKSLGDVYNIIALAAIETNEHSTKQMVPCDFRIDGQVIYQSGEDTENLSSLYFVLTDNYFYQVIEKITEVIRDYEKRNQARVITTIDVSDADENGLVF